MEWVTLGLAPSLLVGGLGVLVWYQRRQRPDLSQTLAGRMDPVEPGPDLSGWIAAQLAEGSRWEAADRQTTHGVPFLFIDLTHGSHDEYPHMSDTARQVCIGYLEQLWLRPSRERAS